MLAEIRDWRSEIREPEIRDQGTRDQRSGNQRSEISSDKKP
jgi:hypothetical protein